MKKYILPFMSIAMLMAMASCSSSDDEVAEIKEESKLVPMTFTATQESNVGTRAALNGNSVDWQTGDEISIFDGAGNQQFTLTGDVKDGEFSGTASSEATQFTAVYPYTDGAQLESDGIVNGITLPAVQTATAGSFDPNAALMMAVSTTDKKYNLDFKNAVSLVKITTEFACKSIVLSANENIAGTGKLTYNSGAPSITFESNQSQTVTLKPATDGGEIAAGTYYIAISPQTLTGFSISFHASDEYCVYTRTSTQSNTFNRSKIKDFGTFKKTENGWEWSHTSRGKVDKSQEVDMGVFNIGGTNYRLIFAKSNLTATGLAASESVNGDYFAWGATETWYSSISGSQFTWKNGKKGYLNYNAPFYDSSNSSYTKYTTAGNTLEAADDAANKILGGDWQIPTQAIWQALVGIKSKNWDSNKKGYKFTNNGQTIFLPAAGYVSGVTFKELSDYGRYWSGTAGLGSNAYRLSFSSSKLDVNAERFPRHYGCQVRPVRLVAVD